MSVTVDGIDELARALARVGREAERAAEQALRDAAAPIRQTAAQRAPRSDDPPHLADNIAVDVDGGVAAIGPTLAYDYGVYQEFGTSRHAAQPFLRPAFDTNIDRSLAAFGAAIWKAIT